MRKLIHRPESRALWALAAVAIAAFIFVQSGRPAVSVQDPPIRIILAAAQAQPNQQWEELGHVAAHFGLFAALAFCSLRATGTDSARAVVLVAAGTFLYGVSDEWHQSFVAARDASFGDIGVDLVGAIVGSIASAALGRSLAAPPPHPAPRA